MILNQKVYIFLANMGHGTPGCLPKSNFFFWKTHNNDNDALNFTNKKNK